jgi:hypothetical protein
MNRVCRVARGGAAVPRIDSVKSMIPNIPVTKGCLSHGRRRWLCRPPRKRLVDACSKVAASSKWSKEVASTSSRLAERQRQCGAWLPAVELLNDISRAERQKQRGASEKQCGESWYS